MKVSLVLIVVSVLLPLPLPPLLFLLKQMAFIDFLPFGNYFENFRKRSDKNNVNKLQNSRIIELT